MLEKIQEVREKYYGKISAAIIGVIIVLLMLSEVFPLVKFILIEKNAISVLILAILMDAGNHLIRLCRKLEEGAKTKFFPSQVSANDDVIEYIKRERPQRADLIEYSAATILDILDNLKNVNCKIRLLIAHPEIAISDLQKRRIIGRIADLVTIDFKGYQNAEIKCYKEYAFNRKSYKAFASLRGRKFDDEFISVGWYTPTKKVEGGILGHENPMINSYIDTECGRALKRMFDEVFETLWDEGIPIEEVYGKYSSN